MSPPITPCDLFLALEAALFALDDDLLRAPYPRLHALLARRRRSVLVLRCHLGAEERGRTYRRLPHQSFDELIATEFRLARMVDTLLTDAPEGSRLRRDLQDLRAEVDEAALSLRLIAQTRS